MIWGPPHYPSNWQSSSGCRCAGCPIERFDSRSSLRNRWQHTGTQDWHAGLTSLYHKHWHSSIDWFDFEGELFRLTVLLTIHTPISALLESPHSISIWLLLLFSGKFRIESDHGRSHTNHSGLSRQVPRAATSGSSRSAGHVSSLLLSACLVPVFSLSL